MVTEKVIDPFQFFRKGEFYIISKILLGLVPIYILLFLLIWQGVDKARANRSVRQKLALKKELIRKNDELKIGIVSYTSAERIEALYRKTYQFLPISAVGRIVTVELPALPDLINK